MVASLVVAVVGFILPFVALMSVADNNVSHLLYKSYIILLPLFNRNSVFHTW